jgi:single-strand DNA-binding protein
VADEIGPSLRWATAQVERTERSGGFGGGGAPSQSPQAAPDPVYGDEEPF